MELSSKRTRDISTDQLVSHFEENFTNKYVDNLSITKIQAVIQPQLLLEEVPATEEGSMTVRIARHSMRKILDGKDDRLAIIVGPCSIHDIELGIEYCKFLVSEISKHENELLIIMRVYFEKPRTTVGWKGLISDPDMDDSCKINQGLRLARKLLVEVNNLGVPAAVEFLDAIVPQYIADQVAWGAIGARTVESQLHRQLAAGLSMPVGFKNGTSGDVQVAVDACRAADNPQTFIGITKQGLPAIVHTTGNKHAHVILRGGKTGPNFSADHVESAVALLKKAGHPVTPLILDASHGNSNKDYRNQPKVIADVCAQIAGGSTSIAGVMIESNLHAGNQSIPTPEHAKAKGCSVRSLLKHGVSVTDACVDLETTSEMLQALADAVKARREAKCT